MDTTKKKQVPLKPCPFCGSKKTVRQHLEGKNGPLKWIVCRKCGTGSGVRDTIAQAIEAWNLRVVSKAREPVTLKPCPFCGSNDLVGDQDGVIKVITCRKCGMTGMIRDTVEAAIAAWNERIGEQ